MNQFKHAKWWRSYLDKLWQSFWKIKFMKNQALELHSPFPKSFKVCKERTMEKRKSKQSEEKQRRQQLQSYFALLEYFPKSIFYMLYTISKLRKSKIQRFKPCMIWSWNEEDMAFGKQLLQVCERCANGVRMVCETRTPPSGVRKFRTPHAWCEFCFVFADSTLDIFFCIFWCNFLSSPCNKPITSFAFVKTI